MKRVGDPKSLKATWDPIENIKTALEHYDRIGVWLSGGADSALGLYITQLYNENTKIVPIHGLDIARWIEGQTFLSNTAADNVLNKVRKLLPEKSHLVSDVYHFEYNKQANETKGQYHQPIEDMLKERDEIQIALGFVTANPPFKLHPQQEARRDGRDPKLRRPFQTINKKWVAQKYEEYGLLDNLFPLTVSCVGNKDVPCEKCFWCKEKYWAFGAYDGGTPQLR